MLLFKLIDPRSLVLLDSCMCTFKEWHRYQIDRVWADAEGLGAGGQDPLRKSQVAICFLRNTGTDPTPEAIGPSASFWREVRKALCEIS